MAATLTLVNPLSADDAQRIGLAARTYAIGEVVTVEDWAASTLVRTGYAVTGAAFPNTLLTGTGPPDGGIGANGSYYLDTAAQRLYGPKTAGAWPVALNPGRGITSAAVSGGRLILTYSDGASVDLGNVQGPSGTGTTDSRLDGLTSLATPNVVVLRDGAGRFRAVAPAVAQDVANKDYTDTADLAFRRLLVVPVSAARTLQLDDEGDQVVVDSTSNLTVTVPPNSSVAFPVGAWVEVVRANTGTVTIAPGSGVTLVAPDGNYALRTRYSVVRLRKTATDTWYLEGDNTSATDSLAATATSAATASALARRDASGRLSVADPSASTDVATKNYVDTRDALYVPLTQRGAASGVATLGADGVIPSAQLPPLAITDTFVAASQAAMLALTAQVGDVAVRTDGTGSWILRLSDSTALASWQQLTAPTDAVISVDGLTGAVSLGDVAASASSLARRQSSGALTVGAPSATTDAVTKAYADALGTTAATASTIARRGTGGTLLAATATQSGELTTLAQVQSGNAAAVVSAQQEIVSRTVSAAATIAAADVGALLIATQTTATNYNVTVPPNSSVSIPVGSIIAVRRGGTGTGAVGIAAGSGVTLDLGIYTQLFLCDNGDTVRLVKTATDTWAILDGTCDTGWMPLTLVVGTSAGSGNWYRVRNGEVFCRGYVTYSNPSNGTVIARIPVGYAPSYNHFMVAVVYGSSVATMYVNPSGDIIWELSNANGGIIWATSWPYNHK